MKSLNIAVVGSGISGLSAAWLLSQKHNVTLFEAGNRVGGHTNTVLMDINGKDVPVDTGFICFNDATYPNLIAMFKHLDVPTHKTTMSFAASMRSGAYEYAGGTWLGMIGQPANAFKLGHWRMINDILRFFKQAENSLKEISDEETLAEFLLREGYSQEFRDNHLLPMAAAIWSSKMEDMTLYPAKAFMRFFQNHGLTKMYFRPQWRSVLGGANIYVERMLATETFSVKINSPVKSIERQDDGVLLQTSLGLVHQFDHVVIASHADEALAMLSTPSKQEQNILGSFSYSQNTAVLHRDRRYMPKRKLTWGAWNYIDWASNEAHKQPELCVSYWMNALQKLKTRENVFVTLNPPAGSEIRDEAARFTYTHPVFDPAAMKAQRQLWSLQGINRTWYCGAHFGAGFHEDGLQSGLAVAEQLGEVRRPWDVPNESDRITLPNSSSYRGAAE